MIKGYVMDKYLINGMDRIEFRNQILECIIGQDENGDNVKLKELSIDSFLLLQEQISKNYKQQESKVKLIRAA